MITIARATRAILNSIKAPTSAVVPLEDALGLVLSKSVSAPNDIPPFTNSAMDGYAVRAADTRAASPRTPVALRVIEDVPAGRVPRRAVMRGNAARIMTGAPLPKGADAVLQVEYAEERRGTVLCRLPVRRGANVRRAGEDIRKGQRALARGAILRPQELGMLAAVGVPHVPVFSRPRVAILATGSELIHPSRTPGPGQIRNCNSYSLIGLVRKYGAVPVDLGIVPDIPSLLRRKLREAAGCDIIITSGGVSVGTHDLVKRILIEVGGKMKFWQVCMKPGKPLAFGLIRGKPVFGLPGNPVSVIVSFEMFVRPAILSMMGMPAGPLPSLTALLGRRIVKPADRVHLIRAKLTRRGGRLYASPTG
ncbi:MAG: molybdopterin molybdotransferase MoeA, partial [Candidatus Aureabacteria bacterium]|nr:molybdopterin molybdotransferase MoeA [Candidatus Auribacterota bacterium]